MDRKFAVAGRTNKVLEEKLSWKGQTGDEIYDNNLNIADCRRKPVKGFGEKGGL